MKELFYIGEDYYWKTMSMGSLYEIVDNGKNVLRSDWGEVKTLLKHGVEVHIRPAKANEIAWADAVLATKIK